MDTCPFIHSVPVYTRKVGANTQLFSASHTPSPHDPPSLTLHAPGPSPCDVLLSVTYHIDVYDRLLTDRPTRVFMSEESSLVLSLLTQKLLNINKIQKTLGIFCLYLFFFKLH